MKRSNVFLPLTSTKKSVPAYTLIFIPSAHGAPLKLSLPKALVVGVACIIFLALGAFAAIVFDYIKLQRLAHDYEKLRAENHSIRSEAAAIVARLESVQNALNRVDNFSKEIRQMATNDPTKKTNRPTIRKNEIVSPIPLKNKKIEKPKAPGVSFYKGEKSFGIYNIGPLSKEDYALYKRNASSLYNAKPQINFERLEFKKTFEQLLAIGSESEDKARELERLLQEVREYQQKIAAIPTLAPTAGYYSSAFGMRPSPFTGTWQMHWGVDISAPVGTLVYSAAAGKIVETRLAEDYGRYIFIQHGNGFRTRYAHLSKILVRPGDEVQKGDPIGMVGDTGRSTGPHLHYEVEHNGKKVDPIKYIHD